MSFEEVWHQTSLLCNSILSILANWWRQSAISPTIEWSQAKICGKPLRRSWRERIEDGESKKKSPAIFLLVCFWCKYIKNLEIKIFELKIPQHLFGIFYLKIHIVELFHIHLWISNVGAGEIIFFTIYKIFFSIPFSNFKLVLLDSIAVKHT